MAKSPGRQGAGTVVTVNSRIPVARKAIVALADFVVAKERANVVHLSITFVDARTIRALNRRHLGKDRTTDVIAFALPVRPSARPPVVGDIYICSDVAREHAKELGIPVSEEIRRLVVHGVLHVLGHDHPEGEERVRSLMWRRQERYLEASRA